MQIVPHIRCVGGNLLHFLYPDCCHGCGQRLIGSEKFLCGDCLGRLTYTGYEKQPKNPLAASMQSKIPIRGASALLFFNKEGVIQKLLHELKYQGQAEIGLFLGRLAGQLLQDTHPFCDADYLVPVPMHPEKLKKRGYNQSQLIVQGMNAIMKKQIGLNFLIKQESTQSQTRKNRESRWKNIQGSFILNPSILQKPEFHHRHFLVVDDVVTTGATSNSCCRELLRIPGGQVSFFAIAHPD